MSPKGESLMNSVHTTPQIYPLHNLFFENDKLKNVHPSIKAIVSYILLKKRKSISNKTIAKYFDRPEDWRIFINSVKPAMVREIIVYDHYVSFYKDTGRRSIPYLVGVNPDSGKLFIDILAIPYAVYNAELVVDYDDVRILKSEDRIVWERGYHYDVDVDLSEDPYNKIHELIMRYGATRIRAQGDLLLRIERDGIARYHQSLQNALSVLIRDRMSNSLYRRIARILSSYFDVDFNNIIAKRLDASKVSDAISFMVKRIIEELDISDWLKWFGIEKIEMKRETNSLDIVDEQNKLNIEILFTHAYSRLDKTSIIEFRINERLSPSIPRLSRIFDEIIKQLEWRPIEEMHGRHKITISNALPTSIAVPIQLPTEETIFYINLPLVTKGFVRLEHPEHLAKILYFYEPVSIDFNTIPVDQEIIERRNYYRIKYKYYLNS